MKPAKIVAGFLAALLIATTMLPAEAAKKKKAKKPAGPITIVADELYFSDKTGEFFGKGNVVITQDKSVITGNLIRGNDKRTEVWTDDAARLREPLTDVTGMKIRYNYGSQFGTMQDVRGKCGDDYITGKNIHFEEGKVTAYDASTTGCPAKGTPDYRVTARKVEIWPEDKLIAYDAKIWIKNFVIYSTPRYKKNLKDDKDEEMPSFGYRDPDGYWIKQHFNYPLNEDVSLRTDLYYYTRSGFRPNFDALYDRKDYSVQLSAGHYSNVLTASGDPAFGQSTNTVNWVTKSPELKFDWYGKPIGKTAWNYRFSAVVGKWTDDVKTSWHQDYLVYFTREPIFLDKQKTLRWNNGFGYEQIHESFDTSTQNVIRLNTSITKQISPGLAVWTGYNLTSNTQTAFAYNQVNVGREWFSGALIKLDRLTSFSYVNSYDITNGRTYENYYTLYRNLHCWNTYLQYQAKSQRWLWEIVVIRF